MLVGEQAIAGISLPSSSASNCHYRAFCFRLVVAVSFVIFQIAVSERCRQWSDVCADRDSSGAAIAAGMLLQSAQLVASACRSSLAYITVALLRRDTLPFLGAGGSSIC